MAERVKAVQPVLEGLEDLVKPKTFEIYVKSMPNVNTQEEIDTQNEVLDEIEASLDGKSIKNTDLFKRLIAEGMIEIPYDELPFNTEEEKQETIKVKEEEPQKEKKQETIEVKEESQEERKTERSPSEIEEKYELEWWQR